MVRQPDKQAMIRGQHPAATRLPPSACLTGESEHSVPAATLGGRMAHRFQETRWSVVSVLRGTPDSPEARLALAELCAVYWYPLYAFARRTRLDREDAQDATQSFFAKIVRDNLFAAAVPERGLLRTFLLAAFKNDETQKRAGHLK